MGVRKMKGERRHRRGDLSRDDLLFLLSILEGELQARDEVIAVLESERTDSVRLAAQYGFSGPENVLRALQRDSLRAQTFHLENVYEKPIAEFKRMLETHKRCSLRGFYQLFQFSNLHRRTLDGQEGQDRSEEALLHKSRGLTSLLDQDRESCAGAWICTKNKGLGGDELSASLFYNENLLLI